jgi:hypothetical protein
MAQTAIQPPTDLAATERRRKRLGQLLSLAMAYRECSRKALARTLGRDPTKLVPGTGIPKLDLVVALAEVLDWPVGHVVAYLWNQSPDHEGEQAGDAPPLHHTAAGQRDVRRWRETGRYVEVVSAVTRRLGERDLSAAQRRGLRCTLAEAYYTLWSLVEALAIARDLLETYNANPATTRQDQKTQAMALYLSGQAQRRLLSVEVGRTRKLAAAAGDDLREALAQCRRLTLDRDDASLEGVANTCVGAIIEADVAMGALRASDGLAKLLSGLDRARDTTALSSERLESYGWWCIYGCNIALRHLDDERALQQNMAIFTNKADEIAHLLDDWPMHERVFTMQHTRWERAAGSTGFEIPVIIDSDDVRIITGAMGRFPFFKETGWQILRTAQVIE